MNVNDQNMSKQDKSMIYFDKTIQILLRAVQYVSFHSSFWFDVHFFMYWIVKKLVYEIEWNELNTVVDGGPL